jgi:putative phosphoesterase
MTRPPRFIGLISDTHGLLRPEVGAAFAGVDAIIHAGDVGGGAVLAGLSAIAPTFAVSGNCDDRNDPALLRSRIMPIGGLTLHVSHGDECGHPTPALLLARYDADIVVFGHTHKPLEHRDGRRVVLNPGAAGPKRFTLPTTVMTLRVANGMAEVRLVRL